MNAELIHKYRTFVSSILDVYTDGSTYIEDPVSFAENNDILLRANYQRAKRVSLNRLIASYPSARRGAYGEEIDLSGGKSRFSTDAAVVRRARDSYLHLRRAFARAIEPFLDDKSISAQLDDDLFHYLDLSTSGFAQCGEAMEEAIGLKRSFIEECDRRFFQRSKRETLERLRTVAARRFSQVLGVAVHKYEFSVVAGSSVYLSSFVLESLMQPGSTLLVPEFSFYGTLNTILPLFRDRRPRPDCTVRVLPADERHDFKVTAGQLDYTIRACRASGDRTRAPKVVWITNPTNLGAVYSRDELDSLARVILQHGLFVISDEIFAGLGNHGRHVSLASIDGLAENLVVIGSSSKYMSFYDGDHILNTEIVPLTNLVTENVNILAGGLSYYLTRSEQCSRMIGDRVGGHCFTLRRAFYSAEILEQTPDSYFVENSAGYEQDRDLTLTHLRETTERLVSRPGLLRSSDRPVVRPLVEPRTGQFLGLDFDRRVLAHIEITDGAQLAAFFHAHSGLKLENITSGADPGCIALRMNFSTFPDVLREATRRLEDSLFDLLRQESSLKKTYVDYLPTCAREVAEETLARRKWALISGFLR